MDDAALTFDTSRALGRDVILITCFHPISPESLTPGERERYAAFSHPRRREDWLRGRGALKSLLRKLALSDDTSRLSFPHPRVSLSHAAGVALAAGLGGEPADGIGVDFEGPRPMRPGTERFYLAAEEREALWSAGEPPPDRLLRLWTIKEALFKADLGNRGASLAEYRLENPESACGRAMRVSPEAPPRLFRYRSAEFCGGHLSVALRADTK